MILQDALDRFLVQLKADGRSDHTIHQYRRHVGAFGAWLAHGGPRRAVANVRHEDVAAFLAAPVARVSAHGGMKNPLTLNSMRTSLRMFFRYLHEAGTIPENPARLVRRALCSPPPPRALPDVECKRLLATIAGAGGSLRSATMSCSTCSPRPASASGAASRSMSAMSISRPASSTSAQ